MPVNGIAHIFLTASNFERSRGFLSPCPGEAAAGVRVCFGAVSPNRSSLLIQASDGIKVSQRSGESSMVGSADKALDDTCKFRLVAIKAGNHGVQHFMRLEFVEVDRVTGIVSQQGEESQLRTAVAFAESVDNV
jgi:hypothetical protein